MTVDEELNKLEDDIRRLKIEYEVYFNGGMPRPPRDTLFLVETVIKRYTSDQSKLNFSQRYRLNHLVQKYAVYSSLWRRRLQEKEEGRNLTGMPKRSGRVMDPRIPVGVARIVCSNPDAEAENIAALLEAMKKARIQVGESIGNLNPTTFQQFIKEKTSQIKEKLDCASVRFSVTIEGGKVKLKAARAE